jgi:molybdopterin-guanine dinucleotide biosynthesis adapter protein
MRVYGITGWKNTGKTTLTERLIAEMVARGLAVSSVKHAHHNTEIDHEGRDSHRHRVAGAGQVIVSSPNRWALMSELRGAPEPSLTQLLALLNPCDLVLIEGYKAAEHPKIEAYRQVVGRTLLAPTNDTIRAIASDCAVPAEAIGRALPVFDLNDVPGIATFILREVGL